MKVLKRRHYIDPVHGWVQVKRSLLEHFNIAHLISPYSYQKGALVYLEQDRDLNLFLFTLKCKGFTCRLIEQRTDSLSEIKSYESYEYEVNIKLTVSSLQEYCPDLTNKGAIKLLLRLKNDSVNSPYSGSIKTLLDKMVVDL